ncbi:non-ribosomal peptide synthetase [Goekera deserti]|uniref:non-ribosomal peptide synthetase n=1 Tax=Goekera deserti TaxID=2497753 RepID=UPI001391A106|nr:non-ribosomal peptide synthetase [Goekera deserti]NDI46776.1 amino acid adenylation domain-containing protein [Goekera deserti]
MTSAGASGMPLLLELRDLLDALAIAGATVRADDGRLRCSAPRGALTHELVMRLRDRRAELLAHLARPDEEEAPLAPAQEALWRQHHLRPGDSAYNIPLELALDGPLSPEALRAALRTVAVAQPALRTVYAVVSGRPRQRVLPPSPVPLRLVDLSCLPPELAASAVGRLAAAEAVRPFDLASSPPWRATLVRLGPATHRLLLTRHHVAADGWSFGILATALATAVRSHGEGAPSRVASPAWRFADHARVQQGAAESGQWSDGAREIAGSLGRDLTIACVPDGRPRPGSAVGTVTVTADHRRTAAVQAIARSAGTTTFAVWAAAFGIALGQASDQESVVVGTPVSGRAHPAAEPLVGCFAGLLPLPLVGGRRSSLRDAVRQAHASTARLLRHQDIPFEAVADAARAAGRPIGGANGIRAVLTFQNTPSAAFELPGVAVRTLDPTSLAAKFPLAVTITPVNGPDGPAASLVAEYATDLLGTAVVEELLQTMFDALDAMQATPDQPFDAVTEGRSAVQLVPLEPPRAGETLADRFRDVVASRPDAVAISDRDGQVTYRELYRRARAVAARLAGAGAAPGTLVAVQGGHGAPLVAAVVGVAMAGAVCVPLDPEDPPGRVEQVITDAGVDVVLTDRESARALEWFEGPAVRMDEPGGSAPPGPVRPMWRTSADELAYVIHTSGSTGAPKGVMVPQVNVLQLLRAATAICDVGAGDVWSMNHSLAFDFSVWELWGALLTGARLVPVARAVARDPARLRRTLAVHSVTVHSATPTALSMLSDGAPDEWWRRTALRLVVLGGERCLPSDFAAWLTGTRAGPALLNMYGITETTVHVTHRFLSSADAASGASPIGRPLPGVDAAVDMRSGELLVGGWGTARGYLHRPGWTADRFRPGGAVPGARRYRTGDRVRAAVDGLHYLGRTDQQVKIRGHRVEPDEVAAVMSGHPDLAGAAAVVRDRAGTAELLGCLVPAAGRTCPSPREMRRFLAERLPAHMIPAGFAKVERLPVTRNGKLNREALPRTADVAEVTDPPTTPTERRLAALWCEILDVPEIGRHDDFFSLGGDSLQATRLHARVEPTFGVELPLGGLYKAFDVATIAAAIDAAATAVPGTPARVRTAQR